MYSEWNSLCYLYSLIDGSGGNSGNVGAIVGAIVGVCVLLILVTLAIIMFRR